MDRVDASDLAHTGTVIARKASLEAVGDGADFCELAGVRLLGLGAHASYRENLLILLDTLLELAEEDAQTWKFCSSQQRRGETDEERDAPPA